MKLHLHRKGWVVLAATLISAGLTATAGAAQFGNGQKAAFFTGGTGTAGWVSGIDPLVPGSPTQVIQLSSPAFSLSDATYNYSGFVAHAIDGLSASAISALSYDFQVTTPGWNGGGSGSPRLVVDFNNANGQYAGNIQLDPVTSLASGVWQNMNAMTGAVDVSGGSCGYRYQASWATAAACFNGATVLDAYVVNDSGWVAPSGFTVQIDNLNLNGTIYSHPSSGKM